MFIFLLRVFLLIIFSLGLTRYRTFTGFQRKAEAMGAHRTPIAHLKSIPIHVSSSLHEQNMLAQ